MMKTKFISFLASKWSSLLYAGLLTVLPWESIRGDEFADIQNYTSRIETIQEYGSDYFSWEWTFVGLLKVEFLWFQIISLAANNNLEAVLFLKSITAICAFINHNYLKKTLGAWWSLAILINPITIDLLSSQVRSALAFSLFLVLIKGQYEKKSKKLEAALLFALPFIHTAMIYVLAVYLLSTTLSKLKKFTNELKATASIVIAVCGAVAISVAIPSLAEAVGDRRGFSQFAVKSVTYLAFWILWGLLLSLNRSNISHSRWEYHFAIVICLSGALMDILGMPGFRFIALAIPIIFSTIPLAAKDAKTILFTATPIYGVLLFAYWIL
jgi:hypothetical protein